MISHIYIYICINNRWCRISSINGIMEYEGKEKQIVRTKNDSIWPWLEAWPPFSLTLSILTPQNWLFWGPYPCYTGSNRSIGGSQLILSVLAKKKHQFFEWGRYPLPRKTCDGAHSLKNHEIRVWTVFFSYYITRWWFQPIWKILVNWDHFPR